MTNKRVISTIALGVAVITFQQASANSEALKVKGFTKLCETSKELKDVHKHAAYKLTTWHTTLQQLTDLETDLKEATKPQSGTRTKEQVVLLLYLNTVAETHKAKLNNLALKATFASAAAGHAAGQFDQTSSIFFTQANQATGGNTYCLEQDNGQQAHATSAEISGCVNGANKIEQPTEGAIHTKPAINKNRNQYSADNRGNVVGAASKCKLTQTDSANGGYGLTSGNAGTIKWAGRYITLGNTAAAAGSVWADTSNSLNGVPAMAAADTALSGLEGITVGPTVEIANLLLLEKDDAQTFKEIQTAESEIGYSKKDEAVKVQPAALETARKLPKAYREKQNKGAGLEAARKKALIIDLTIAALDSEGKQGGKCPEVPKKENVDSEKEAECNAKQGGDCKERCKWDSEGDRKKCVVDPNYKPKQEEEANQDSKTTNTKGSNSCAIHKHPLLLAVFSL
uniref:Variant surface glycoprotein n=1 Tax=Trypanosoma brucei TaxID=5691 RepID=A0A1V0FXY5_9TRYP|nr:variant surface glycoprotein [Trypanosoma brucei]